MKWTASFALVACFTIVSAQDPTEPPKTTAASSVETTTARPASSSVSTPLSSSTSSSTTAPPASSSTTTPKPSPTTPAPPAPPAPKEPSVNSYNVTEPGTNHTCVLMTAALQLKYIYPTTDNKTKVGVLPLDNETAVDHALSSCGMGHGENQTQTLALRFSRNYTLTLVFFKNATVYLGDVSARFSLDPVHFPNASLQYANVTVRNNTLMMYSVPEGRSYHCTADQAVYIGAGLSLDVISVQMQAFINATTQQPGQFGAAVECVAGGSSNTVRVAVGATLVAVVIIAFIVCILYGCLTKRSDYEYEAL
ncbi:lysosome-associated membrane glycoprotein 1-like [Haemaphysalis longicornis]